MLQSYCPQDVRVGSCLLCTPLDSCESVPLIRYQPWNRLVREIASLGCVVPPLCQWCVNTFLPFLGYDPGLGVLVSRSASVKQPQMETFPQNGSINTPWRPVCTFQTFSFNITLLFISASLAWHPSLHLSVHALLFSSLSFNSFVWLFPQVRDIGVSLSFPLSLFCTSVTLYCSVTLWSDPLYLWVHPNFVNPFYIPNRFKENRLYTSLYGRLFR